MSSNRSLFPNHCEQESFSSMDDALLHLQTRLQQLKKCLLVLDMLSEDDRTTELRANALGQIQELERLQAKGLLIQTLDMESPPVKDDDIAGMDAKIARCERMVSLLETSGGSDKELRKIHKLIGELKTIRNRAAAQKAREAESDSGLPPLLMGFLHLLLAAQGSESEKGIESEKESDSESDSSASDSDSSDSDSDSD